MSFSVKIYEPGEDVTALVTALRADLYPADGQKHQPAWHLNQPHHCRTLLLFDDGKPVGMVACYLNPGILYQEHVPLLVGYFTCIQDRAGAEKLFDAIETVARERGCRYVIGPMNGSTWDAHRLMLNPEPALFFTETSNPRYYNDLFVQNGYGIISRYASHITQNLVYDTPALLDLKKQATEAGYVIRPMRKEAFQDELRRIYPLCMAAFQRNFLYAPISEAEFVARYLSLAVILDPTFALVAEDATGLPVGFMLCLTDLLQPDGSQLIIKTVARHPALAPKGIMAVLGNEIYRRAAERGFSTIIHAFMHETNRSNRLSGWFGGEAYRTYGLYGKDIIPR